MASYKAAGLRDYGRVDVRLAHDHEIYVVEANPNPYLSDGEDMAWAAEEGGYPYGELLEAIVELGASSAAPRRVLSDAPRMPSRPHATRRPARQDAASRLVDYSRAAHRGAEPALRAAGHLARRGGGQADGRRGGDHASRRCAASAAEIAAAAQLVAERLAAGGRMVYVGAGTSGRLGTLDAAECVPTFGIPPSLVVAIIAGGPARPDPRGRGGRGQRARGRAAHAPGGGRPQGRVICIAASGVTPFVRAALGYAHFRRASTVFVTCRKLPPTADGEPYADVVIELPTGPEVIAGSTRLKAGTATKITLNTISTTAFVLLGKTYGGLMVDVRPTNAKLWARAVRIVCLLSGLDDEAAAGAAEEGGRARQGRAGHAPRPGARGPGQGAAGPAPGLAAGHRRRSGARR